MILPTTGSKCKKHPMYTCESKQVILLFFRYTITLHSHAMIGKAEYKSLTFSSNQGLFSHIPPVRQDNWVSKKTAACHVENAYINFGPCK